MHSWYRDCAPGLTDMQMKLKLNLLYPDLTHEERVWVRDRSGTDWTYITSFPAQEPGNEVRVCSGSTQCFDEYVFSFYPKTHTKKVGSLLLLH